MMHNKRSDELFVAYGSHPQQSVSELLCEMDIGAGLPRRARIGIKPNLVVASPSSSGATTDPSVVSTIIDHLRSRGFNDIVILESAWLGDDTKRAYRVCGYEAMAAELGVELVDLKDDRVIQKRIGGKTVGICQRLESIDYLINVPVLKAHCQTRLTCALKNLKGCIPTAKSGATMQMVSTSPSHA